MAELDPQELFGFLSKVNNYPVSGHVLAGLAEEEGTSHELVEFFESLPGYTQNEAEIIEHASRSDESPRGVVMETPAADVPEADVPELTIEEVVKGEE